MDRVGIVRGGLLVCVVASIGAVAGPSVALGDTGQLTYGDCLTSDTDTTGCAAIPGAASGPFTPLGIIHDVEVSPDGADVYSAAGQGAAVTHFRRDPSSGGLRFIGCITSNNSVDGCLELPDAAFAGVDTSLDGLEGLALSPDGTSLYTAAGDGDAVAAFTRNPGSGTLAFQSCITSDTNVAACTPIPGATADGTNTGLNGLEDVEVSPDGAQVYASVGDGDGVATFSRDAATGGLTYGGCISSNSGVAGCSLIPGAAANGTDTGLARVRETSVSSDGKSLYAVAYDSDAVARFDRAPNGTLAYRDCITSSSAATGCAALPGAGTDADDTPLGTAVSLDLSADGGSLFVAGEYSSTLSRFDRDPATGALTQRGCLTGNSDITSCAQLPGATSGGTGGLALYLESVVASADGNNVYGVTYSGSVVRFARDALSGDLTFSDCLTASTGVGICGQIPGAAPNATNTAFSALSSAALSPDGRNLYAGAEGSGSIARLQRELPANGFTFGKLKRNKRKGIAKLTVALPGKGTLALVGKGVKDAAATALAAGEAKLLVKARGKAAKRLRKRGKAKVGPEVTFTPTGGVANTQGRRVKLIRKRRK